MDDKDTVLLTDALATGYFGAQLGDIAAGAVVAVLSSASSTAMASTHGSAKVALTWCIKRWIRSSWPVPGWLRAAWFTER
jgi:hypothetical protein